VIGIDQYNHANFDNLDNAVGDALRIKKILEDVYGFESVCKPLINGKATRNEIINELLELHNKCSEDDNVIIFFAGHGIEMKGKAGCWIPIDAVNDNANQIADTDIVTRLRELKAKHVLIISDSCFSGKLFQKTRSALSSDEYNELESLPSRWVFASGQGSVKDGVPGDGSNFCNSICQFLEANKSRVFAAGELFIQVIEDIKQFGKQVPSARVIDMKEHQDGQMVFRSKQLSTETKERGTYQKPNFSIPEIKSLQYYIPRTVSIYDPTDNEINSFFSTGKERSALRDEIIIHKRIVLLGSAGSGKSVELNQLARTLQSAMVPFIPVFKRFNTYTDQDIENYLPDGWEMVAPSSLVLFLDGLDEIQINYFHTALRKINAFAEQHRTISIVISCRSNFYDLPKKNFDGPLTGFSVFNLNDVSTKEIIDYATTYFKIDGQSFYIAVEDAGLKELIHKPYFLDIIIRYYNTYGELKGRRSAIMEDALENYYWQNKEHFKTTVSITPKEIAFEMLEKIAFVMEMRGTNFLSDSTLQSLFATNQEFENCKYLPAFIRDDEKEQWMFEHNNIQEFLAARILERQPYNELTAIVGQDLSGQIKIKPTWVNTLSFLVAIGDEKIVVPLLDWIVANDPEVLVRFDGERLPSEKRISVFMRIFSDYADKGMWVISNNFSDEELAAFGHFPAILDFLLTFIEDDKQPRIVKLNALHLLDNFDLRGYDSEVPRIKAALVSLLKAFDSQTPVDTYGIQSVLGALSSMEINDDKLTDWVVNKFSKRLNQHVRSGLYKYLHTSPYLDKYVEVFLEGLQVIQIEGAVKDRESVNLMDESFHLKLGLEKIKQPEALLKLMQRFGEKNKKFSLFTSDYREILEEVVKNLVQAFETSPEFYKAVLVFYKELVEQYNHDINKLLIHFFEKTGTKTKALIDCWYSDAENSTYHTAGLCELLLDSKTIRHLIDSFTSNTEPGKDFNKLYELLEWNRYNAKDIEVFKQMVKEAADEYGITLMPHPKPKHYNEILKEKLQPAFDLLFRPNDFIQAVRDIFKGEKKEQIVSEDLYGLRGEVYIIPEESYVLSALEFLRDLCFRGMAITMSWIEEWVAKDDFFLQYRIDKVYNYLRGNNSSLLQVSEEQKEIIKKWCMEVDLTKEIAWFFLKQFGTILSQERLLDLTTYYNYTAQPQAIDPGIIDDLEAFLSKDLIKARVIHNLEAGLYETMPWISNASYAIRNGYNEVYPSILGLLQSLNNGEGEYKLDEVIELWFGKTKDYTVIKSFIETAVSERFKWKAISLLLKENRERSFLVTYLNKRMNDPHTHPNFRFDAANYLMQIGELSGFDFIADMILKQPDSKFDFHRNLRHFKLLTNAQTVNKLIELLAIAKRPEFQKDNFNSLESPLMEAFYSIGVQSEQNFSVVKQALEKFIKENTGKIEHINFLFTRISSIEEQLRCNQSRSFSVTDALAVYNRLEKGR
jgi:hypothetical protein